MISLLRLFVLSISLSCCSSTPLDSYETLLHSRRSTSTFKAGLAWPNAQWIDINQYLSTGKVSWYYSWSPSGFDTNLEFVPMLWGTNQVDQWQATINQTISQHNVTSVLGFNEPQNPGQSNLTAQQGADLWKSYIEPLKSSGIRLGSPAPDSAPDGKTWLQDWLSACAGGCTPDFIAIHWYDVNSSEFISYLQDFHQTFNLNLWVTEWDCQNFNNANAQCSASDITSFMNETQSFMDETEWVERYAWYGAMENLQGVNPENAIMTPDGKINSLGEQYIGATNTTVASSAMALWMDTRLCTLVLVLIFLEDLYLW